MKYILTITAAIAFALSGCASSTAGSGDAAVAAEEGKSCGGHDKAAHGDHHAEGEKPCCAGKEKKACDHAEGESCEHCAKATQGCEDGGCCDACTKGKAGETVWCSHCSKGFIGGEAVTCEACYKHKAENGPACGEHNEG